jgi:hypothetical protein
MMIIIFQKMIIIIVTAVETSNLTYMPDVLTLKTENFPHTVCVFRIVILRINRDHFIKRSLLLVGWD